MNARTSSPAAAAEAEAAINPMRTGPVPPPVELELTDAQKIDYVYRQALAVADLIEQAGPLIAQAGPLLESAGPLLAGFAGQASSPMARILGSVLR
jgi:hypothetical protein